MFFWKKYTRFGQLPLIIVPLCLIGVQVRISYHDLYAAIVMTIISGITVACSYIGGSVIKFLYFIPRPAPQPYSNWLGKIDASSFPSIHTSNSIILAFRGTHMAYSAYGLSVLTAFLIALWLLFFILMAYSRVVLRKHYPIDIMGGIIFGACCIYFVLRNAAGILYVIQQALRYIVGL
jgi:membrane-associated phospholipid phosphatase